MPGRAEAALRGEVLHEGRLQRMQVGPVRRGPARSRSRGPRQVSASVRQDSCGSPSISTVHTPQVPCPQPNFGDVSPTPRRSALSRLAPPSTKTALSPPLCLNWTAVLVILLTLVRAAGAQVDGQDFAAVPGGRDGIVRGRDAFRGDGDRGRDAGVVERTAFQRALHRARADRGGAIRYRRREHRRCARPRPAAVRRSRAPHALRLHARHLPEAERVGAAGRGHATPQPGRRAARSRPARNSSSGVRSHE